MKIGPAAFRAAAGGPPALRPPTGRCFAGRAVVIDLKGVAPPWPTLLCRWPLPSGHHRPRSGRLVSQGEPFFPGCKALWRSCQSPPASFGHARAALRPTWVTLFRRANRSLCSVRLCGLSGAQPGVVGQCVRMYSVFYGAPNGLSLMVGQDLAKGWVKRFVLNFPVVLILMVRTILGGGTGLTGIRCTKKKKKSKKAVPGLVVTAGCSVEQCLQIFCLCCVKTFESGSVTLQLS